MTIFKNLIEADTTSKNYNKNITIETANLNREKVNLVRKRASDFANRIKNKFNIV